MLERNYQRSFVRKLKHLFPGCIILKNDSSYIQGIPDVLMLYNDKWAAFELKASPKSSVRPNQAYYVEIMNNMSFAAFVCAENEEEVLDALQHAFESSGPARFSES